MNLPIMQSDFLSYDAFSADLTSTATETRRPAALHILIDHRVTDAEPQGNCLLTCGLVSHLQQSSKVC